MLETILAGLWIFFLVTLGIGALLVLADWARYGGLPRVRNVDKVMSWANQLKKDAKRSLGSYHYKDGIITVYWRDLAEYHKYIVEPKQLNNWLDSHELYLIMLYLPAHPEGMKIKMDGIEFKIMPVNGATTEPKLVAGWNTRQHG